MTKSNFEKVCEFNKAFEFPQFNTTNAFENKKICKLRHDLIYEEGVEELSQAYIENNIPEIKDALCDNLYVVYGAFYTFGMDPQSMFDYLFETFYSIERKNLTNFKMVEGLYFKHPDCFENSTRLVESIKNFTALLNESLFNPEHYGQIQQILFCILFQTYKLGVLFKFDLDELFNQVHESNMSKLCKTEEEAQKTVTVYQEKYTKHSEFYDKFVQQYGVNSKEAQEVYSPYDSAYYYPVAGGYYAVKNKSTGKALKSIEYVPVNFS